ncbi:MAG: type ISP restriction/modification enzyme [Aestuariivirga sp.]
MSKCNYRPFDLRYCLDESVMDYPRWNVMRNCQGEENFALNFCRQTKIDAWGHALVSRYPAPAVYVEIKDGSNFAPLYYHEEVDQTRRVNFDPKIRKAIEDAAGDKAHGRPDEVAIFDYIYGVLHCPAYRETYREFLKIDFPRVPYPTSPDLFWNISAKGTALRRLHLMEDAAIGEAPYSFTGEGDSVVGKVQFKPLSDAGGAVYINDTQCFENMPLIAWEFHIGGYQPAQKWLKDRKGRPLEYDDIRHYQKIVKILSETDRIMKTITMPLAGERAKN